LKGAAGGGLTLSWPLANAGFTLMSRTDLVSGAWTPLTSPVLQIIGEQWQVTVPFSQGAQYYRLQQ
jgi:hypothetical protein